MGDRVVPRELSPGRVCDGERFGAERAQSFGINAIPAFLLDRRLIVPGVQALETFRRAFAQLAGTLS